MCASGGCLALVGHPIIWPPVAAASFFVFFVGLAFRIGYHQLGPSDPLPSPSSSPRLRSLAPCSALVTSPAPRFMCGGCTTTD